MPGSRRRHLGEKTIEGWFYAYRRQGIEGLLPKPRSDRGQCKLPLAVQQAIVAAKQDNPRRSIRQIRELLEAAGSVAAGSLSRSAIHRLLQQQRSEEHTSELQSLMRISYAVFCLKKKKTTSK